MTPTTDPNHATPAAADPRPDGPRPDGPWPVRRRSFALPGVLAAMVGIGLASGAYMVWHPRLAPDRDGGQRCTRTFDAPLRAARGGTDADLVRLAEGALGVGCGRQALDALGFVDEGADEPAAWLLARFYDPGVADPALRDATAPDAARAAALYARWAARSPRMSAALASLCAASAEAAPALRRACER